MTAPNYINAAEVAARLGMAPAVLRKTRQTLEERHGFPQPLPWALRPLRWRSDQDERWLSQQGLPKSAAIEAPEVDPALIRAGKVRLLAEARRA